MAPMNTILIVLLLVAGLLAVASFTLGRITDEVESARDTEYIELEGAWVRYSVIGAGPPVLLVHGWLSSSRVWERLARRLAQRFTVYTLDLKGFGDSDKPLSGYGVRYGSRLLYAFCAHFGLTNTAVIAHDLGGDMAVKLAADHPGMVGRLALVSAPADEDQIDLPTPLWLATLPVAGPLFYTLGQSVRGVRVLWLRPFFADRNDLTDEAIEDAGKSTPAAVAGTLAVTKHEISGGRLARQARAIKVPVLIVAGEDDQIVDPQSIDTWARTISQAEVHLMDECGHMPMIEHPAEFNARMLAFLTGDRRYLETVADQGYEQDRDAEDRQPIEESPAFPDFAEDETMDLTPQRDEAADDERLFEEEPSEAPNIHRKQAGHYAPEDSAARHEEPPAEPEPVDERGDEPPGEQPPDERVAFEENREGVKPRGPRDRQAPNRPNRDPIAEIPEDLFEWPEEWDARRRREGYGERRREDRRSAGGDEPEEPRP